MKGEGVVMHYRNRALYALMVSLFAYSVAYGCDCLTLNSEESFQEAESVFYGRVLRIERSGIKQEVVFEVKRTLKGTPADKITLHQDQSNCDFRFEPDSSYLVYANASSQGLYASTCSSNRAITPRACGYGRAEFRTFKFADILRSRSYFTLG